MDKRYQVFDSSTFDDLEEARKEVSSALLKSDCFPAGMELFPAADLEQFEYVKTIIDESDYFLLVSAGRYGSIHPEHGISYTELEYDYALQIGKPIVRLLHRDPFNKLLGKAIEQSDEGRKHLKKFREKLSMSRIVNFWDDPKDLGQQTILALVDMKKRRPATGWVRADNAMDVETLKEIEELRKAARDSETRADKTETLVTFEDLKGSSGVMIKVALDEEDSQDLEVVSLPNSLIVEAVFLALISNSTISDISIAAGDILTTRHKFDNRFEQYSYFWLELGGSIAKHCLHYLESRGLVRGMASPIIENWQLTTRGRMHATYMSSLRNLE